MIITGQKYAYIRTFGCQMNVHDSEKISLILDGLGYKTTSNAADASIIIYNTCTIREKAHHKAVSEVGRALKYKKKKKDLIIGVCGCVAQEMGEKLFERFPDVVNIVFGPDQIHKLPELLNEAIKKKRSSALELVNDAEEYVFLSSLSPCPKDNIHGACGRGLGRGDHPPSNSLPSREGGKISSFVSIIKGCNLACSYCIVPSVRGREVSKDPEMIIDEVAALANAGTKEVVLLGQNVTAYRSGKVQFAELLRRISKETGILRIRFTSPHPKDVKEDLVREYAENGKLMPHIHLPLQAGSNAMLKKMKRGYTREHYIEICEKLKAARKGMSITTDIIVGFCGETNADFEDTIDLMKVVGFDSCFAFKYSPRPGTFAAEKFKDDVSEKEKEERLEIILNFQREATKKNNECLIGTVHPVLATEMDQMSKGLVTGRIPDNRLVHFAGNLDLIGNILDVKIIAANANSLKGEITQSKTE